MAPNHGHKLWRSLILLQDHGPLSCHFISVMTHRFSIYATNCIEAGCGPSQSQAGPAVHLGKRRWLNRLGRAGRDSVSLPTIWKQPASSNTWLSFLHSVIVFLRGGRRQVGAPHPGLAHLAQWGLCGRGVDGSELEQHMVLALWLCDGMCLGNRNILKSCSTLMC